MSIVQFDNVSKIYTSGDHELRAPDKVSFTLDEGKFVVILGLPAGLGTLQWMLSALAGEYEMKLMLGPLTYSVSILLTFGTSLFVGWLVARKNRKIDMVEALKNAE